MTQGPSPSGGHPGLLQPIQQRQPPAGGGGSRTLYRAAPAGPRATPCTRTGRRDAGEQQSPSGRTGPWVFSKPCPRRQGQQEGVGTCRFAFPAFIGKGRDTKKGLPTLDGCGVEGPGPSPSEPDGWGIAVTASPVLKGSRGSSPRWTRSRRSGCFQAGRQRDKARLQLHVGTIPCWARTPITAARCRGPRTPEGEDSDPRSSDFTRYLLHRPANPGCSCRLPGDVGSGPRVHGDPGVERLRKGPAVQAGHTFWAPRPGARSGAPPPSRASPEPGLWLGATLRKPPAATDGPAGWPLGGRHPQQPRPELAGCPAGTSVHASPLRALPGLGRVSGGNRSFPPRCGCLCQADPGEGAREPGRWPEL